MAIDTLLDVANRALFRLGAKPISSLDEASDSARACKAEADECRRQTLRAHPWNFARKRTRLTTFPAANLQPGAGAVTVGATVPFVASLPAFDTTGLDVGMRIIGNSGIARISSVTDSQNLLAVIETAFADATTLSAEAWRIAPAWEWEFRYGKPADYLRLVEMRGLTIRSVGTVTWSWWRDLNNTPEPVKVEGPYLVSNIGGKIDIAYTADIEDITRWDALAKDAFSAKLALQVCYAVTGSLQAAKTQHDMYREILAEARTSNGQEGTADESGSTILVDVRMM